jgi:hypothetical protein
MIRMAKSECDDFCSLEPPLEQLERANQYLKTSETLKILHLGNTAGVGSIIAETMDRIFATRSDVIMQADRFGLATCGNVYDCGPAMFKVHSILKAAKYDIIHSHSSEGIGRFIKKLYGKSLVMHFHGSDIRGRWAEKRNYWAIADRIFYAVKDVESEEMPKDAVYVPNPVNTELFYDRHRHVAGTAVTLGKSVNQVGLDLLAMEYAERFGLHLTIQNSPVHHPEMPGLLSRFEYYIDAKSSGESTSKTGLEALACGCKVINRNGDTLSKLSEEHLPENVAKKIWDNYPKP